MAGYIRIYVYHYEGKHKHYFLPTVSLFSKLPLSSLTNVANVLLHLRQRKIYEVSLPRANGLSKYWPVSSVKIPSDTM